MELIYILVIPVLAAIVSLIPVRKALAPLVTVLGAFLALILSVRVAQTTVVQREVIAVKNWITCDSLGALVLLLVAFIGFASAVFSWGYMRRTISPFDYGKERRYYIQYNLFFLSMLAVPLLCQVALVWIAVELTTLLSVFLVSFESTSKALEAAWKYVVLTCMGAAFALMGILILYWGMRLASGMTFTWSGLSASASTISHSFLKTAFFFILIGFGTKVGLVPLHTWLPDAHSQAPSPVCALLSGIETTVVLYVVVRLLPLFQAADEVHAGMWFVIFGLVSVGVAAFLLLQAKEYKRMFAFSTIEHMGIILVAVGIGGPAAHFAAVYQILGHALTKSLCFLASGVTLIATKRNNIDSVQGLIRISPLAGVFLCAAGLGIAGSPPFAVFISELSILRAGIIDKHYGVMALLILFIVIAFVGITIHINRMVFGKPSTDNASDHLPASCVIAILLLFIPALLFGFDLPSPLYELLSNASTLLGR